MHSLFSDEGTLFVLNIQSYKLTVLVASTSLNFLVLLQYAFYAVWIMVGKTYKNDKISFTLKKGVHNSQNIKDFIMEKSYTRWLRMRSNS